MAFKDLDPILHSQLRLAIVSLLVSVKEAEFTFIKEQTNSTAGNLSVQLQKLKEVNYVEIEKSFKNNYPQTLCKITATGIKAFDKYIADLQDYLNYNKNNKPIPPGKKG
ncbi:MAG: transcriptional regulator [Bacteroidia bacterium]|nr:transcriptional regulator [Bacteroidia bacterium]